MFKGFCKTDNRFTVLLLVLFFAGCAAVHYREGVISQLKEADAQVLQAQYLEAPVYAPERFLEARLELKRANELFSEERFKEAGVAAQMALKTAVLACEETRDERKRINDMVERLLYRANQLWNGYQAGDGKRYAPSALLEIKDCIDEGYALLSEGDLSEALKTAQKAHRLLALMPDFIDRGKLDNLHAEESALSAEEILNDARKEAERITGQAREKAEQIIREKQRVTVEMRKQEFERLYPSEYVVQEGETLMDISARREIFNDPYMWLLIYKANRDQIRDPKFIYPGQTLSIPRHMSFEDIVEARRQASAPDPAPPAHAYSPEFYQKYMMISPEKEKE